MRTGQHERRARLWPVQSDEMPARHHAARRPRPVMTMLVVIGILLTGSAGGWFAYEFGVAHVNARVNATEADQRQRAAERTHEFEPLRRSACATLARLPSDPEVDRDQALDGCGPAATPAPSAGSAALPTAAPSPSATGGSGARSDAVAPQAANPAAEVTSPPAPAPAATPAPTAAQAPAPKPPAVTPTPTPRPTPTGSGGGLICLPIVGCLL